MLDRRYFKTDKAHQGYSATHPKLQEVMRYAIEKAEALGVKNPVITETLTTAEVDKALQRVSASHQQGRAFDMRTWNMDESQLKSLYGLLTSRYGSIGAWTKAGPRQLVVHHDSGHGDHFHVQLDRDYSI